MNRFEIEKQVCVYANKYMRLHEYRSSNYNDPPSFQRKGADYYYFRIKELGKKVKSNDCIQQNVMTELVSALYAVNAAFSLVLFADGNDSYELYVGTDGEHERHLMRLLVAMIPGIKLEKSNEWAKFDKSVTLYAFSEIAKKLGSVEFKSSGFLKGIPFVSKNTQRESAIDIAVRGLRGRKWYTAIFATPALKTEITKRNQFWANEATACSILNDTSYTDTDTLQGISYKQTNYECKQYFDLAEAMFEHCRSAMKSGEWIVTTTYGATAKSDAQVLGQLLVFNAGDSPAEPMQAYENDSGCELFGVAINRSEVPELKEEQLAYSSRLSSEELAELAKLPEKDMQGIAAKDCVEFDVSTSQNGELTIGRIIKDGSILEQNYSLKLGELNRHCLVVGLTGSGKTNTIKAIISDLQKAVNLPFMIIEPAKKEYWELYKHGISDLQVYTLGGHAANEHSYRLNPFEPVQGTALQTHIDSLFAAFKASFIMYTPMPYVLERAIYAVYEDYGWNIKDGSNSNPEPIYPTLEDLYYIIEQVVVEMGYDRKMQNDLIGSLQARINSLRIGSKGEILNVRNSFPIEAILDSKVIIELEDIGDEEAKSFIISLLLVQIMEYRRLQPDSQKSTRHILAIEEAHRLLKNLSSGTGENADPRGNAVDYFCNMLAELRSKGQSFIIADQIPTKLAPDIIKNTNTKIVHRIVAQDDREVLGGSMYMTEEQNEAMASLPQGTAAVRSEGDTRPKLVRPRFAGTDIPPERKELSRSEVLAIIKKNVTVHERANEKTTEKCEFCARCIPGCKYTPEELFEHVSRNAFDVLQYTTDPSNTKTLKVSDISSRVDDFLKNHVDAEQYLRNPYLKNCAVCKLLQGWHISNDNKKKFMKAFFSAKYYE